MSDPTPNAIRPETAEADYIKLLRGWAEQEKGDDIDLRGAFATVAEEAEALTEIRWQEAIDKLVRQVYPDRDGSGSDGDALALTLAEINQAFNHLREQIPAPSPPPSAGSAEERLREALNIGLCLCSTARALAIYGGHRSSEIAVNATEEELRQRLAALAGK
jgi:hypothetical protein